MKNKNEKKPEKTEWIVIQTLLFYLFFYFFFLFVKREIKRVQTDTYFASLTKLAVKNFNEKLNNLINCIEGNSKQQATHSKTTNKIHWNLYSAILYI